MPMFEIVGDDGHTYHVDADNEQSALSAIPHYDKYQQWAKQTVSEEQKRGGYLPGVMQGSQRKILQGLTGNFADDAMAYGHAVADGLPFIGRGKDLPFDERLKYEKARQAELNRVADEKSGIVGDVAGGLASALGISRIGKAGGTLLKAGQSLPVQMAAGAAEGAGYGSLYGAGEGDGMQDRASKAISGGLGGGVFGAALPGALAVGKLAAAPVLSNISAARNPEGFAAAKYGSAILDAKTTPEAVMQTVNDANAAGVPMNIADAIGKSGQRLLYTAASAEGPGREMVTTGLNNRQAGQSGRVGNLIEDALGASRTARQAGNEFTAQARRDARPLYEASDNYPIQWNDNLEKFINDPIAKNAFNEGVAIQRLEALANDPASFNPNDFTAAGYHAATSGDDVLSAGPNMRSLDAIKKGLDAILEKQRDKTTGRLVLDEYGIAVDRVRRRFLQELDNINPAYAKAREAYAGPASQREAIGLGKQMATGGRAEDNVAAFNALNDAQKVGARVGYADKLLGNMENSTQGTNVANRLLTPKKQAELEAMSLFQGPSKQGAPNEIARRLAWEDTMNQTRNQALMGSRTAENLADQQTGGVDPRISGVLGKLLAGHPVDAATQAVGHAFQGAGNLYGGNSAPVREQLARIGLSTGDVDIASLLRRATAQGRKSRMRENRILQGLLGTGASEIGSYQ